ncbi:MAG TPA: GNAT family N-acetyltransferase [Ktedonobacterales bacterium]|nr:GNAT family N-acetyltransferase [Ktedonobacterales bacterium]
MMNQYRFSDATGYTLAQMTEMHNQSFSGYFMPATMTPEMTAHFWRVYQIDANRSVVMYDQAGAFVGMARMGTRGTRGWCGGFGITPAFRGSGASKLLAAEMVRVARDSGLATLQLEVLTQNVRAFKLYQGVGFVTTRKLIGLQVATASLPAGVELQTEAAPIEKLLPFLSSDQQPDWERELASILTLQTESVLASGVAGRVNGLIARRAGERLQVLAAILQPDCTNAELAALLRSAAGDATTIQVYNEPEGSALLARYLDLGFTEFFSQYEMMLTL